MSCCNGPCHIAGCKADYYDQIDCSRCVASCPVNGYMFDQMVVKEGREKAEGHWKKMNWKVPALSPLADSISQIRFGLMREVQEKIHDLDSRLGNLEREIRLKG